MFKVVILKMSILFDLETPVWDQICANLVKQNFLKIKQKIFNLEENKASSPLTKNKLLVCAFWTIRPLVYSSLCCSLTGQTFALTVSFAVRLPALSIRLFDFLFAV